MTMTAAPAFLDLLRDGALRVEVEPEVQELAARWLPNLPAGPCESHPRSRIRVRASEACLAAGAPPSGGAAPERSRQHERAPTLRLGKAAVWIEGDGAWLCGAGGTYGWIDLAGLRAELRVRPDAPKAGGDLYSLLTIASALLLGRSGRALVHAAGVARDGEPAWLLIGDARAGKTTTCANLIRAGWRYLSDDQLVLSNSRSADGRARVEAEGWPRAFHLDEGWNADSAAAARPAGRRESVDPARAWPGRWRRAAPVGGLLFTRIEPERPTAVRPLAAADALTRLLRQSPWLLSDRAAAPAVLDLLRRTARRPAFELHLGLDTFADPERLVRCLEPAVRR